MRFRLIICVGFALGSLVACSGAHPAPESPANTSPSQDAGNALMRELGEMGTPTRSWPPAALELFAMRLDRIEYLERSGQLKTYPGFLDRARNELDAVSIGPLVPGANQQACAGITAAEGSNAAFACLNKPAPPAPTEPTNVDGQTAKDLAGQIAIMDKGQPPPVSTEKPTRLREAMQMLVTLNAPCQILAERARKDFQNQTRVAAALGCYEQIEPFIDDQVGLAREVGDQGALKLLTSELTEINRYRTQLAQLRRPAAGS